MAPKTVLLSSSLLGDMTTFFPQRDEVFSDLRESANGKVLKRLQWRPSAFISSVYPEKKNAIIKRNSDNSQDPEILNIMSLTQ